MLHIFSTNRVKLVARTPTTTVKTRNFRILQPGTSGISNQLAVSATCAKSGTSGFSLASMLKCVREAFVSLSTHMGYLSTRLNQRLL